MQLNQIKHKLLLTYGTTAAIAILLAEAIALGLQNALDQQWNWRQHTLFIILIATIGFIRLFVSDSMESSGDVEMFIAVVGLILIQLGEERRLSDLEEGV